MTGDAAYDEAVNWLYDLQYFGMKLGLANTRELLCGLGNPHEKFVSVHVAGTNGKGSVCAFITSILMDAGLKVGTYTSPHLSEFGERICVGGYPMTRSEIQRAIQQIKPKVEALESKGMQCTFFEVATCMAFKQFARRNVDIAVVEVGMGGRLDSTNVIMPALSIITNISREHTQHLGETLAEIASEKAGIIKNGVPVVSAVPEKEPAKVIASKARVMRSRLYKVHGLVKCDIEEEGVLGSVIAVRTPKHDYGPVRIRLPGEHQALNASTSMLAAEILASQGIPISTDNIVRGMESTRWAARLQTVRLNPTVILDATHNPGGAETLAKFLKSHYPTKRPVMVLAMLEDKEVGPVVSSLEPLVRKTIVSQSSYHRRMKAEDLATRFTGRVEVQKDLGKAIDRAMDLAGKEGAVIITGSIFTVSDALRHLEGIRIAELVAILQNEYGIGAYPGRNPENTETPKPGTQDPFRVLISTILSQRTKDENTHVAAEALFSKYKTPAKLASANPKDVESLIKPAGFYRQKARNIIQVSRIIRDSYSSEVPSTLEELMSLPGVGRKTANCVLSYGFGKPAIAVDTHVHRICNLIGLANSANPEETELQLAIKVKEEYWHDINRLLVRHGQTICSPIKPKCGKCPVSHLCDHGIYCHT